MLYITSKLKEVSTEAFSYGQIEDMAGVFQPIEEECEHLRFISNGLGFVIYVNLSDGVSWGEATTSNNSLTFTKVAEAITFG